MRKKIIFCLLILFWFINKDKKEYFINNQENIYSNKLTIKNIENIKKGQKIMSNMLKSVDILCINNNINYWCLGGTLIGVLRHKGWIPWDADIDIGMLEKDYNNFKSVVNQLPNNIHFSEPKNKPCFKLRSTEAKYTYADWAQKDDLNKGIQLDIFLYKNNNGIIVPHKNNYLGNICGVPDKKKRFFNDIFPLKREKFEDFLVYIPNKYKKISEELWGGYPPKMIPREKRLPHEGNIKIIENNFSNTKIINNYEVYSENDKYYPNYKINLKKKNTFLKLLKFGDNFFQNHKINYSICYGTLLGFVRNKKFIPYDHDLDCIIGKDSFKKLINLGLNVENKNIFFNDEIIKYKPNFDSNNIYLILNKSLLFDKGYGERYNCSGIKQNNQSDRCSFRGIIGRFILNKIEYDIFPYNNNFNILKKYNFYLKEHAYMSELKNVQRDKMENIEISVLYDLDTTKFLKLFYGNNFMIPNK